MSHFRIRTMLDRCVLATLVVPMLTVAAGCATVPAAVPPPASPTSLTSPPSAPVEISDQADNSSLVLHPGQTVHLSLHNLYWNDPVSTTPGILSADGPASRTRSGQCPVGSGCGSVSARFVAVRPGTTQLRAHRSSCGEAKPCGTDQGEFAVTITVD